MSFDALAQSSLLDLSKQESWLNLLHYRESGVFSEEWESEADDPSFFLSESGATSPLEELVATHKSLFVDKDQALICKFPARYQVIARFLELSDEVIDDTINQCTELREWKDKLNPETVTIVFPAAYLDSPSSMFGHTLLRLDKSKAEDSSGQLSYTYSFAAQMPESGSELAFVYRGLVGGYPGETATPPYYLKLKEYQDIESRDIWEYQLQLDKKDVALLLHHIWEIKDIRFDYYFFSENCSYRVMALLHAIKPDQKILHSNRIYTIPVVTVRDAFEANMVKSWRFRPSARTQLDHDFDLLDKAGRNWVVQNVPQNLDTLKIAIENDHPDINVLDVAYQYSRMLPEVDGEAKKKSFALLRAKNKESRKAEGHVKPLVEVPTPAIRDDQGHESERFGFHLGSDEERNFVDLEIRPAYHELIDPAQGFPAGSELVFGKASLRLMEGEGVSLNSISVIDIKSLKSVTPLFNPMSWTVSLGLNRDGVSSSRRLAPTLAGAMGKGLSVFDNGLIFALAGGEARFNTRLNNNTNVLGLINAGAVYKGDRFRAQFDYKLRDSVFFTGHVKHSFELTLAYQFSRFGHLVLNSSKTSLNENDREHSIGLHYFF